MKKYSVKNVANLLETNPETVRRWIREGKLKAKQDSKKGGNVITEKSLCSFLLNNAKYGAIVASGMALGGAGEYAGLFAGVVGSLLGNEIVEELDLNIVKMNPSEILDALKTVALQKEKKLADERDYIFELRRRLECEERKLAALRVTLDRMEREFEYIEASDIDEYHSEN